MSWDFECVDVRVCYSFSLISSRLFNISSSNRVYGGFAVVLVFFWGGLFACGKSKSELQRRIKKKKGKRD